MMVRLLETETAVTAWTRTWLIQIDVYLGVPQCPSPAVADRLAAINHVDGDVVDECHGTEGIWLELHGCLLKSGAAGGCGAGLLVG